MNRKYGTFDAALELRAAAAAAITTTGGDRAAPDWESSVIEIGPGRFEGRVVIDNVALTLPAEDDGYADLILYGCNDAGAKQAILGEVRLGCLEMTGNAADDATGQRDVNIMFTNAERDTVFPKVQLAAVIDGTSFSLDFTAWITLNARRDNGPVQALA